MPMLPGEGAYTGCIWLVTWLVWALLTTITLVPEWLLYLALHVATMLDKLHPSARHR
jgi:hypothetical protein